MEEMINSELVKHLRKEKSWSQEHLATVAGLSVRTIQRIESQGTGSLESRKALAAVFEVEASTLLIDKELVAKYEQHQATKKFGYLGVGVGTVGAISAMAYSYFVKDSLSLHELGISLGVLGIIIGLSVAIIGMTSKRMSSMS